MDQEKVNFIRKEILIQLIFIRGILRSLPLLFRGVVCPSRWLTITGTCEWNFVWVDLLFFALPGLLLVLELIWDPDWKGLIKTFKSNWLVIGFVGLAVLSLSWSILFNVTLYKLSVLLIVTFMALYIGHVFRLERLIQSLTWFFCIVCLLSLSFVYFYPAWGIMAEPFYQGAWSGIFGHRNPMGIFMALAMGIYLVNIISIKTPRKGYFYFNVVMLLTASFLLLKSKSATGMISALAVVVVIILLFSWIKWGQKLKSVHYLGFLGFGLLAFIIVLTNLNFFLGILGRNASLTGRVPMWQYLFQHVIFRRPWLGYGYGAIWHLKNFPAELGDKVGWAQVLLGDSGYIDILLHLGIVGLSAIFILIIVGFIRGIGYFLRKRTIIAAFPIVVLIFSVVANVANSLILESETLVWIIAVATLVSIENKSENPIVLS